MRNGETTLRHLLAPIQDVLDDPATTELVVQRPGEVGIEQHGQWCWRSVEAFDFQRLDAIGLLAGSLLSKPFDPAHPICMTTLAGRPAMHAAAAAGDRSRDDLDDDPHPVESGAHGARSRFRRSDADRGEPASPGGTGAVDRCRAARPLPGEGLAGLLRLAVRAKKTIAATGSTGSGKTSLLRRLMQEIPGEERLVTIEDTDEFGPLPLRNRVSMFYGSANVSAENAVEASLRMRPDRVAMQEMRGAEAFAYIRLLAAGHPGGLTTWHAEDGDPFTPLALMAKKRRRAGTSRMTSSW